MEQSMEKVVLEKKFEQHCGELMAEYFPAYTLEDYLGGNPIPPDETQEEQHAARNTQHLSGEAPFPRTHVSQNSTVSIST